MGFCFFVFNAGVLAFFSSIYSSCSSFPVCTRLSAFRQCYHLIDNPILCPKMQNWISRLSGGHSPLTSHSHPNSGWAQELINFSQYLIQAHLSKIMFSFSFSLPLLLFSHPVVSTSLRPHGLQQLITSINAVQILKVLRHHGKRVRFRIESCPCHFLTGIHRQVCYLIFVILSS